MDKVLDLTVAGNHPYNEEVRKRTTKLLGDNHPTTDSDTCILCGMCARVCPKGCVTVSNLVETDKNECIACTACVNNCPTEARRWEYEGVMMAAKWLSTEHGARKEPEIFI